MSPHWELLFVRSLFQYEAPASTWRWSISARQMVPCDGGCCLPWAPVPCGNNDLVRRVQCSKWIGPVSVSACTQVFLRAIWLWTRRLQQADLSWSGPVSVSARTPILPQGPLTLDQGSLAIIQLCTVHCYFSIAKHLAMRFWRMPHTTEETNQLLFSSEQSRWNESQQRQKAYYASSKFIVIPYAACSHKQNISIHGALVLLQMEYLIICFQDACRQNYV